jgi:hypothetical protein
MALRNGGGAAALRLIRDRVFRTPADDLERVAQAYLTRMIAHCARKDPSSVPAALALSREILKSKAVDPGCRVQAAAGLGGLSSAELGAFVQEGKPPGFYFTLKASADGERGPFEDSLAEAARADVAAASDLLAVFERDEVSEVRRAAAMGLPAAGPPGWENVLRSATLADQDPVLRSAAFLTLTSSGVAGLDDLARRVVTAEDQTPESQTAAIGVLTRAAAADAGTRRFLADCLNAGTPADALPALVAGAFETLEKSRAAEFQPGLASLLLRRATTDEGLVEAFVEQAVARGMTQFQPLFLAMESSLPEGSASRLALVRGARQLEDAPRFAALARRMREDEGKIRALWSEINQEATPEVRRAALREEIGLLTRKLWEKQDELSR